jgi:hypothetical protein
MTDGRSAEGWAARLTYPYDLRIPSEGRGAFVPIM